MVAMAMCCLFGEAVLFGESCRPILSFFLLFPFLSPFLSFSLLVYFFPSHLRCLSRHLLVFCFLFSVFFHLFFFPSPFLLFLVLFPGEEAGGLIPS